MYGSTLAKHTLEHNADCPSRVISCCYRSTTAADNNRNRVLCTCNPAEKSCSLFGSWECKFHTRPFSHPAVVHLLSSNSTRFCPESRDPKVVHAVRGLGSEILDSDSLANSAGIFRGTRRFSQGELNGKLGGELTGNLKR